MNVWKTRHYTSDHGGQPTANSKSLVQRQRRTDDRVSWVGNAAEEVGDDWQSVVAVRLLAMSAKLTAAKAYCTPMYGCQLWSSSFQYSLNKLKVAYNDEFRLLFNEPWWRSASSLFVYHNVPTFDALIRKLIYALWRSCHNSSNVLVDKLFASDIYFESKIFKRWRQLLY